MNARRLVIVAAALSTMVAAALATVLIQFSWVQTLLLALAVAVLAAGLTIMRRPDAAAVLGAAESA